MLHYQSPSTVTKTHLQDIIRSPYFWKKVRLFLQKQRDEYKAVTDCACVSQVYKSTVEVEV